MNFPLVLGRWKDKGFRLSRCFFRLCRYCPRLSFGSDRGHFKKKNPGLCSICATKIAEADEAPQGPSK